MTPAEILAMSGEVVSALWPEWWHNDRVPPPDLTEPDNFVRALKLAQPLLPYVSADIANEDESYYVWESSLMAPEPLARNYHAGTPELALLLALHALVRRRKEKANG